MPHRKLVADNHLSGGSLLDPELPKGDRADSNEQVARPLQRVHPLYGLSNKPTSNSLVKPRAICNNKIHP